MSCEKGNGIFRFVGVAFLVLSLSSPADAQSNADRAQALFDEAARLWDENHIEAACEKLDASLEADPGVGTALRLAACRDKVKQVSAAWAAAKFAEDYATLRHDPRLEEAKALVKTLAARLVRLRIQVPTEARCEGLVITRDGKPVPVAEWDALLPIDQGSHRIVAAAPGREEWSVTVDLQGEGVDRDVAVPPLKTRPIPPPKTPPLPLPKGIDPPPSIPHDHQLGAFVRAEVGIRPERVGAAVVTGLTYGVGHGAELGLGAVIGAQPGGWLGITIHLTDASFKPFVTTGAHLLVVNDFAYAGAHGAVGVQWDVSRHLGFFAALGLSYFPQMPEFPPPAPGEPKREPFDLVFLPSLGVQGRL